jgi:4-hydroxybenzoate polyprenyltransferase/phosphoserine phosphatase
MIATTTAHHSPATASADVPLVVDLDGTLIKADLLMESVVRLLRANPLYVFMLPLWLLKGKVALKGEIARRVSLQVALLPFNRPFLDWLRAQHAAGRTLVLATASTQELAEAIARHLGIFGQVFGSADGVNLGGRRKRDLLVARFGAQGFDYAGNAAPDLHIWPDARRAILVNPDRGVERRARRVARVDSVMVDRRGGPLMLVRAIRAYQWLKNLLVFVALLASHTWSSGVAVLDTLLAFAAFSMCASAIYLVNDAFDLDADRAHPRKRNRPMAAGDLGLPQAALAMAVLLALGFGIAACVSAPFTGVLLLYVVTTLAYSLWLKKRILIDVMVLGALYTLRVIAGAVAIAVQPSFWLIAFSMFLFTSLALVKRCAELKRLALENRPAAAGRDYRVSDLEQLNSFGAAAGNGAVVVLAFYINSPDVRAHYHNPAVLWMLCPLLMYWIGRTWIKVGRDEMHDDPIVFAFKDRTSQVIGLVAALLFYGALWT